MHSFFETVFDSFKVLLKLMWPEPTIKCRYAFYDFGKSTRVSIPIKLSGNSHP